MSLRHFIIAGWILTAVTIGAAILGCIHGRDRRMKQAHDFEIAGSVR